MPAPPEPIVKLPQSFPRKPVLPGPNSWAQSRDMQKPTKNEQDGARPTNRERYENKSMPERPEGSSTVKKYLQPKAYIQPAIPLSNPGSSQKNRAVTEPIAPKPLFGGKKASVTQLRKNFMPPTHGPIKTEDQPTPQGDLSIPTPPSISKHPHAAKKAAHVLGMYLVSDNSQNTPPTSAHTGPLEDHIDDPNDDSGKSARQVQSTPVPTARPLRGSDLPLGGDYHGPAKSEELQLQESKHQQDVESNHSERLAMDSNSLAPPKFPSYKTVGDVGVVEEHEMYRVESFQGVIEDAADPTGNESAIYPKIHNALPLTGDPQTQTSGEFLPSTVYSPSVYSGVWENDPAVGFSLPPFSPMPRGFQQNPGLGRDPPSSSIMNMPTASNSSYGSRDVSTVHPAANRRQHQPQQFGKGHQRSANFQLPQASPRSWISESRGNSFASTNPPPSALLPPRWPLHQNGNSVPSPPHSNGEYPRPNQLSATLAQLDLTLHHHIDTVFGSLSRQLTDKVDRVLDETIRRLEGLDEGLNRGFKNARNDVKDMHRDMKAVRGATGEVGKACDSIIERLESLERKVIASQKHVDERADQHEGAPTSRDTDEPENDRPYPTSTHRRTESADGALAHGEQRRQHRSGLSRSSNKAHKSGRNSRSHRSSTTSGHGGNSMSNERSNRGEYFAELGAAMGPTPDLRNHPAYSSLQQVPQALYDSNGMPIKVKAAHNTPYTRPSLGDNVWYDQAFGQGH